MTVELSKTSLAEREHAKIRTRSMIEIGLYSKLNAAEARGKVQGRIEGKAEGRAEVIRTMKAKGFNIDVIAQITGFKTDDIMRMLE